MKATVSIEIDTDHLTTYTDTYLAELWHVSQANPASFGDEIACGLASEIGFEIKRRWLNSVQPELFNHQFHHISFEKKIQERRMAEGLEWIRPAEFLPDDDIMVLVIKENGEVDTAIFSGGCWTPVNICSGSPIDRVICVKYWAHMPGGPDA